MSDRAEALERRGRALCALKSIGGRLCGPRDGAAAVTTVAAEAPGEAAALGAVSLDALDEIVRWLPAEALLACARTCKAWLWVALRHGLLLQLATGEIELQPHESAQWLQLLEHYEWRRALDACRPVPHGMPLRKAERLELTSSCRRPSSSRSGRSTARWLAQSATCAPAWSARG